MTRLGQRSGMAAGTVSALCLAVIATACQSGAAHGTSSPPAASSSERTGSPARVLITPASGSRSVAPGAGIRVHVLDGSITGVTVEGGRDHLSGWLTARDTVWQARQTLRTGTRYTVRVTAVDEGGRTVEATSTFRTLTPSRTVDARIFEGFQQTYGVGMPIILDFSQPVVNKRAVERSLELRTSRAVVGVWYWDGDSTLYFRPRSYWPPYTTVRFVGHLDGVEVAPGVYGVHTLTQTFRIGRSLIAVASTVSHHVQIYLDRHLFGDWPSSSGRPGDDTPNGTYLTIEKQNPADMIGPGYNIEVPWSVRFTWSGDYLHDAYWSVGQQGFTNVSHGCVNLSPAHAETYYGLAVPGDPVTITGSPRAGTWDNGWTVWFLTWRQLLGGSALHQAVRAGPNGSAFVSPGSVHRVRTRPPLQAPAPGNAAPA
ncbi:MAG: Ig-like domain-containing protein [Gaiellales bacterium]